ncbi:MAG: MazG-like family protein [Clostridia bacterium]|nr:MazG-like family protein [Clostridia bacterium]MDD4145600.1 MazG-like family protein [Clostridia bacterium]MDD4665223.1 MazG-like family protein [Clostridia bacterium]
MAEPQLDIVRNIEALDCLKADLASFQADLYQALLKGDADDFLQASSKLIITCFLLTKRIGLNFGHLEKQVYHNTQLLLEEGNRMEEWYGDISALKDYWDLKR